MSAPSENVTLDQELPNQLEENAPTGEPLHIESSEIAVTSHEATESETKASEDKPVSPIESYEEEPMIKDTQVEIPENASVNELPTSKPADQETVSDGIVPMEVDDVEQSSKTEQISEAVPSSLQQPIQNQLSVTEVTSQNETFIDEKMSESQLATTSEKVTPAELSNNDQPVQYELCNSKPSTDIELSVTKEITETEPTQSNSEDKVQSITQDKNSPNESSPSSSHEKSGSSSELTNGPAAKKQRLDDEVKNCPTGLYLDKTVVPILRMALITLDRLRPEDPMQYIIDFLLQNKEKYSHEKRLPPSSA